MDQEHNFSKAENGITEPEECTPTEPKEPTRLLTRIFAALGALLVIVLTILYSYSIATGKIFAW